MTLLDLDGYRLVLASASPRRSDLLRSVGLQFEVLPADIDESVLRGEVPADYVARLSKEKASKIAAMVDHGIVVAADTTVDVDDQILEKPVDDADVRRMLGLLSGRTHLVHTGVTVLGPVEAASGVGPARTIVVETAVRFVDLTARDLDWYVSTGDAVGKAGGYGIQGAAGAFVERIDGSVTNVIGLPLAETLSMLAQALRRDPPAAAAAL